MGGRGGEINATVKLCVDPAGLGGCGVRFVSYSKSREEPGVKGLYEGHPGCLMKNSLQKGQACSREPRKELKHLQEEVV